MKLKLLLMATALLLPISSVYAETTDEYVAGLKKEASIGNTEAQKELDKFQGLSKKANAGDAQAQYDLGMFYKGKADPYSYTSDSYSELKLQEWFGKAAHQGNANAQQELIAYYKKIISSNDYNYSENARKIVSETKKKLENLLLSLVNKGDAKIQYELAMYYASNSDDDKISEKAGPWMVKAADQGLDEAMSKLGQWYLRGVNGVDKNYNKAKAIFQKLADKGNNEGLFYLANCYENGLGATKDKQQAIKLYEQAADNGYINAANRLAIIFLNDKDTDNYMKYYNKVCFKDQLACMKLKTASMQSCSGADPYCMSVFKKIMPGEF
ncbi:tetratricopeptide repeat protein [Commensalibacter papalotli (ex Botero et al. 2024)]|uniref:Sel1 repeat family protein n=1 Tax=Commensalibacter papalotli (ex Botero et al. 2024) TaxID=2972766 RepID=A0ABM9HL30_9PROT|nr:tetratricopeptide repeat protein [Commensalibacter papalotli (ex Botero et al. 2024)]CAI3931033.1 unnamed protein product [Commensalibacter papalotli (ex Botero et al. 2024)]CAI3947647.1 unnamed protein product [Commensalibacter papalotli (ex Botero et al. 2024)]